MPRRGTISTSRATSNHATAWYAIVATARCSRWPRSSATSIISRRRRRWSTRVRANALLGRAHPASASRLERSAAANAMIGVADDPGRPSPHPRNDPLRLPVAIGDESGARGRRLPSTARGGGISVTCRQRCPRQRNRRGGESAHLASPFAGRLNALLTRTDGSYGGLPRRSRFDPSIAGKTYVKLNDDRVA